MIIYLTYHDQPSGVYWSQVTDVVAHMNTLGKGQVRLVALVSIREFRTTRKRIRDRSPNALVVPMFPQLKRWRMNTVQLAGICRLLRPTGIMARGPFATWMALRMRERGLVKRVCFDGRGAYAAEWEEYRLVDDDALIQQFRPVENEVVNASDFRLAVSHALVDHWRDRYGYASDAHVVVPCTLADANVAERIDRRDHTRAELGYNATDLVLVYAGSTAGWQSFPLVEELLCMLMERQPEVKVLFLSKEDANNRSLASRFPGRVRITWLSAKEVPRVLAACDHGILVRESTVTNQVASPTKFAEYLLAGLPVIISHGLGDFSALVDQEGLGIVIYGGGPVTDRKIEPGPLSPPLSEERERLTRFARHRFAKAAYDGRYRNILVALSA